MFMINRIFLLFLQLKLFQDRVNVHNMSIGND